MAVHRLPSIRMSSPFQDRNEAARQEKETDRVPRLNAKLADRPVEPSSWTRSPSLTLKRPAYALPLHEDHEQSDVRMSLEAADAVLSPAQRKRRRGDSDMSMSGRSSGASPTFGSVRITSTSIRALVHDEDGQPRRSVTFEDAELSGRDSWAGVSSRGSGRDSDLWEGVPSPKDAAGEELSGDRASVVNASRTITFEMLQTHFSKPLKDAANHFGVCTTLLKKICRKNGILSWPYRQIIGLEKSIASMEQQVHYFDGEQRRQYAGQLRKLQIKLDAYIRTGQAPSEEELTAALKAEASSLPSPPSRPAETTEPLRMEYSHPHQQQPHVGYYSAPQGSIMASAVTLDAEEPPQRYEVPTRPTQSTIDPIYDQRYAGTATYFTAAPGFYNQRPLPSLASILNPSAPQQQHPDHYATNEARREEHEHHWRH